MKNYQDLIDLSGKSAIVTGGAKGIGLGIALRLAQAGAKVLIADTDIDAAEISAKDLESSGFIANAVSCDVSKEEEIKNMISTCVDKFGSLDILVNNAGIFPSVPIAQMPLNQFERIQNVNLKSVFLSTKYACEEMKKQGGGKIINITSIDAIHPSMVGLAAYDSSKHGVWGFTKNAALEYAPYNIWINAIAPGGINTPGVQQMQAPPEGVEVDVELMQKSAQAFLSKIPMHRMGEPDDIGKVALFLASDMASYITGQQIVVDGGFLLT